MITTSFDVTEEDTHSNDRCTNAFETRPARKKGSNSRPYANTRWALVVHLRHMKERMKRDSSGPIEPPHQKRQPVVQEQAGADFATRQIRCGCHYDKNIDYEGWDGELGPWERERECI